MSTGNSICDGCNWLDDSNPGGRCRKPAWKRFPANCLGNSESTEARLAELERRQVDMEKRLEHAVALVKLLGLEKLKDMGKECLQQFRLHLKELLK